MHSKSHRLSGSSGEGSIVNGRLKFRQTLCRVPELSQMRPLRPEASPQLLKCVRTFRDFKRGKGGNWEKNVERSTWAQDHNFSDKRWGARLLINGKRRSTRIVLLVSICIGGPYQERVNPTWRCCNLPRVGFELMRVRKSSRMPLRDRVYNLGPNDDQKDEKSGWRS